MKLKTLFCYLLLLPAYAFSDVQNCLKDAETNGNHHHAVAPGKECLELLKKYSHSKYYQSPSGKITAVGLQNMFYLTAHQETVLMAGDQTKLQEISFIRADEEANRVFVFQSNENMSALASYRSDFVGNVAPLSYLESPILNGLTNVALLKGKEELALVFTHDRRISFINMLADSRYKGEKFSSVVKRSLEGEDTGLIAPKALTYSEKQELLFVLDSNRILAFTNKQNGNAKPLKTYKTHGTARANQLLLDQDQKKLMVYEDSKLLSTLEID